MSYTAATGGVASDTGTDATITLADGTNRGLMASADFTKVAAITGTNTGDQTTIVGITGTKAQFDTAVTDGNILYVGDAPTAHTHPASEISDSTAAGRSMLTAANVAAQTALLDLATTGVKGLAPTRSGVSTEYLSGTGVYSTPAGGSGALDDLTDVVISGAAQGQVVVRGAANFQNLTAMTITLGPFHINGLAGTATTDATLGYFTNTTAVARSGNEVRMDLAGRIVGMIVTSDAARTAGTATVAAEVDSATQAFNGGAVQLNATQTTSDSSFVSFANGVAFTAGQTIGAEVTTSGWTLTTADLSVFIVVMLTPF